MNNPQDDDVNETPQQEVLSPTPQYTQQPAPFMTPAQEKQAYANAPAPAAEFLPSYSPNQQMSPQPGYMHAGIMTPQSHVAQPYGYPAGAPTQAYGYAPQPYGVQPQHQPYGFQTPVETRFDNPAPVTLGSNDTAVSVEEDEDPNHPDCRVGGFISAVILAIVWFIAMILCTIIIAESRNQPSLLKLGLMLLVFFGGLLNFVFHIIVCVPGYASGAPKVTKFIPALLGTFMFVSGISGAFALEIKEYDSNWVPLFAHFTPIIMTVFSYFSFMHNDNSGSFLKYFKTWTQKESEDKISI